MASKFSRKYQEFFNKLRITAKDLDSSRALDILKEKGGPDVDYYGFLQQYISISNKRLQRYNDYENMVQVPELELGLTSYADDGSQMNNEGQVIKITSPNDNIIETLEETFFENLDMNADLWKIVYGTCMYGDNFYEVIVDDKRKEILTLKYLPPHNVERVEVDENILHFLVRKGPEKGGTGFDRTQSYTSYAMADQKDVTKLEPWEVVHFRIESNHFVPYGRSVLESGRRTFKQLSLMEDAMLVYRLERAPEKRVFYIDVGTLSTGEAEKFIDRIKAKFRKKKYIDPVTGNINEKATPLSILEDFWIPVRSGQQGAGGTRIDVLQGGRQLNEIDDTKYFRDKLLKTMHIPPQYMQEGGGMDTRNALSQIDIKFARTVERIQRHIIKGLEKVAIIALMLKGWRGDDLRNFSLELTPPSNIAEMLELEVLNTKLGVVQTILGLEGFLPRKWVYKNIMKFSDKEIADIITELQLQYASPLQQMIAGGGGEGGLGGGALGGGGMGAGAAAPPIAGGPGAPELPGEEAAAAPAPEGGEEAAPPPEEAPPPPEAPAAPELASQEIDVDRKKFIMDNRTHIAKLFEYLQQREKRAKDNNDKSQKSKISEDISSNRNTYKRMNIRGEFKGLKGFGNTKNKK